MRKNNCECGACVRMKKTKKNTGLAALAATVIFFFAAAAAAAAAPAPAPAPAARALALGPLKQFPRRIQLPGAPLDGQDRDRDVDEVPCRR